MFLCSWRLHPMQGHTAYSHASQFEFGGLQHTPEHMTLYFFNTLSFSRTTKTGSLHNLCRPKTYMPPRSPSNIFPNPPEDLP